jgi:hypothetical protein
VAVLSANWAAYAEGTEPSRGNDFAAISEGGKVSTSPSDNRRVFRKRLLETVRALRDADKEVVLVGPIPELAWSAPERLAISLVRNEPFPAGPRTEDFLRRERTVLAVLEEADRMAGVTVVYPHKVLCGAMNCAVVRGGKRLYFDDNHIDTEGNRILAPAIDAALGRALARNFGDLN